VPGFEFYGVYDDFHPHLNPLPQRGRGGKSQEKLISVEEFDFRIFLEPSPLKKGEGRVRIAFEIRVICLFINFLIFTKITTHNSKGCP